MTIVIYCAGTTKANHYAQNFLHRLGYPTTRTDPGSATHVLLDVPSFGAKGQLRGGGAIEELLKQLPKDVILCGGNLDVPETAGYRTVDLLRDEDYLARNAYLTAEAALDVVFGYLPVTIRDCRILVAGWGRIGKCLAFLLKNLGAKVTVAVRKTADRAGLCSLGFDAVDYSELRELGDYRLIINTVPALVLPEKVILSCREDCIKIDLASVPGMEGQDIIRAGGLPGMHLPESSGALIAERLDHYLKKEGYS